MNKTSVIHARIDPETKAATEEVLDTLGLTPTEAIRLLYRQIALRGEFPLELKTPNLVTATALRAADRGEDLERFETTEELVASWDE